MEGKPLIDQPPPELTDVTNPQQLARYVQWQSDVILHVHRCMEEVKDMLRLGRTSDSNQVSAMENHLEFHKQIDVMQAARHAVWRQQGKILGSGLAIGGTVVGLLSKYGGSIIAVFK